MAAKSNIGGEMMFTDAALARLRVSFGASENLREIWMQLEKQRVTIAILEREFRFLPTQPSASRCY